MVWVCLFVYMAYGYLLRCLHVFGNSLCGRSSGHVTPGDTGEGGAGGGLRNEEFVIYKNQ